MRSYGFLFQFRKRFIFLPVGIGEKSEIQNLKINTSEWYAFFHYKIFNLHVQRNIPGGRILLY